MESNHPNHGCVISQSYSDGGGGVGGAVGIGEPVAVLVFDPVGDALGVADLTGGIVELGVLAFVAAGAGVEVVEGADDPALVPRDGAHNVDKVGKYAIVMSKSSLRR